MDEIAQKVVDGRAWREFCDLLADAGEAILAEGNPTDPLDRAELRRRNLIPAEKMPYEKPLKTRAGETVQYDSGDYPGCQAELLRHAGWDDFPRRQREARAQGRHLGIGLGHGVKGTGRGPFEFGGVRVSPTGHIFVSTGAAAMGQGLATALAQICAQTFGVRAEDVTVVAGDTAAAALGLGGFASRQTVTAGSSVPAVSAGTGYTLNVDPQVTTAGGPAYDDPVRLLWTEASLPPGVPSDGDERSALVAKLDAGRGEPAGWVVPVHRTRGLGAGWGTSRWTTRREHLFLTPGDSPVGLRLPLSALSWKQPPAEPPPGN